MNKIYIGLSRPKKRTLSSSLIMWGEDTDYSHAYIRRKSNTIGEYIYQATAMGGVNFMGIDIFKSKNIVVEEYEFLITSEDFKSLLVFFVKNAGRSYSFKQIKILSVIALSKKLNLNNKIDNKLIDSNGFICSELGAIILRKFLNIKVPDSVDLITPKGLRSYLLNHGNRVV